MIKTTKLKSKSISRPSCHNSPTKEITCKKKIINFSSNSRNEASQKLNDSQNALGLQRRRNDDAGAELTTATAGKAQKEAECESQRTLHARDTEHRQKEVGIIRQVEGVLATKLEGASSYLEQRVNTQQ